MMSLSYGPVATISVALMTNFIFLHENAELSTKTGGNPASLPPKLAETGFEACQKPHENQRPAFCQKIINVQALFLERSFV